MSVPDWVLQRVAESDKELLAVHKRQLVGRGLCDPVGDGLLASYTTRPFPSEATAKTVPTIAMSMTGCPLGLECAAEKAGDATQCDDYQQCLAGAKVEQPLPPDDPTNDQTEGEHRESSSHRRHPSRHARDGG